MRVKASPLLGSRGFSLIEVLISAALFALIFGAGLVLYSYTASTKIREEARTDLQQNARAAIEVLERDLYVLGYGVPKVVVPATLPAIAAASATALSFWAEVDNVSTTLTGPNNGSTTLPVANGATFAANDVVYVSDVNQWQRAQVTGAAPGTLQVAPLQPTAMQSFATGSAVTRPRLIAYSLNGATLMRDAGDGTGPQPLTTGVTGLTFAYYDRFNALMTTINPADIREVRVAVTFSVTSHGVVQTYGAASRVRPRNL